MASDSLDIQVDDLLDTSDFTLDSQETEKGGQAVQHCLGSIKNTDTRQLAEDNLHTLAVLISGGSCDAGDFPWHQVRSYHSAAALSILREEGIPARIEGWRCHLDDARKFHQVPKKYSTSQVQRMASTLHKVLNECHNLGFLTAEERDRAVRPSKAQDAPIPRNRILTDSEFRALAASCNMDTSASGPRDALILYLGFQGGLRVAEIIGVGLQDLHFDSRRGQVTVRVREAGKSRARIVPLQNEALIALEDWMELRESKEGPLLCPIHRNRLELRKLTASDIRDICDGRAAKAGVAPFAPQELRRNWEERLRAKKRRSVAKAIPVVEPSPLFSDEEPERHESEKIQFPYLGRTPVT